MSNSSNMKIIKQFKELRSELFKFNTIILNDHLKLFHINKDFFHRKIQNISDNQENTLKSIQLILFSKKNKVNYDLLPDYVMQIEKSFDDVNTYYRSLFGENLVDPEEESGKCPTVYYDEDTKTFLKFTSRCGGTAAGYFMTYISDYQKTKDSITVTMSVGYANEVDDEVYSDYRLKDETALSFSELEVVGLLSGIEKNENNHYMITDDNKDQFSQYKLTFKKLEEDVYYFDRVMQVK